MLVTANLYEPDSQHIFIQTGPYPQALFPMLVSCNSWSKIIDVKNIFFFFRLFGPTPFLQVLHVDRNNYYGGDCASLNLTNLYAKFRPGQKPAAELGHPTRDYNVDLIPKFLMANGNLVKMLLMTKVRSPEVWGGKVWGGGGTQCFACRAFYIGGDVSSKYRERGGFVFSKRSIRLWSLISYQRWQREFPFPFNAFLK